MPRGSDTASGSIVITDGAGARKPLSWAVRLDCRDVGNTTRFLGNNLSALATAIGTVLVANATLALLQRTAPRAW